ncbi:GFA family protein [Colwelliaceae bacterium 6471]
MNKSKPVYTGSCLCGLIRFQIDAFMPHIAHCHCTMCQKFHGAAFSTFGEVKNVHFHWLEGEEHIKQFQADNQSIRYFCDTCGSSLLFCSQYNKADNTIEVAIATIDTANELEPDAHIYTKTKVSWFDINDDLPQFLAYRSTTKPSK